MKIVLQQSLSNNKKSILFLVLFITLSFILIAFDHHDAGLSNTCPICQAKNSINGSHNLFTINVYHAMAYHYSVEKPFVAIIPILETIQSRAPPF